MKKMKIMMKEGKGRKRKKKYQNNERWGRRKIAQGVVSMTRHLLPIAHVYYS